MWTCRFASQPPCHRRVPGRRLRKVVGGASELLRAVFNRFGRPLVFWKGLGENLFTCSRKTLFLDCKSIFRSGLGNRAWDRQWRLVPHTAEALVSGYCPNERVYWISSAPTALRRLFSGQVASACGGSRSAQGLRPRPSPGRQCPRRWGSRGPWCGPPLACDLPGPGFWVLVTPRLFFRRLTAGSIVLQRHPTVFALRTDRKPFNITLARSMVPVGGPVANLAGADR
jgi:hypothetical protein